MLGAITAWLSQAKQHRRYIHRKPQAVLLLPTNRQQKLPCRLACPAAGARVPDQGVSARAGSASCIQKIYPLHHCLQINVEQFILY